MTTRVTRIFQDPAGARAPGGATAVRIGCDGPCRAFRLSVAGIDPPFAAPGLLTTAGHVAKSEGHTATEMRWSAQRIDQSMRCHPSPGMRGASAPCHVFGDGGLTDVDAELEKFAMDPRSAPRGLARLISRISRRISAWTLGLPLRDCDFQRQNKRKPARCQRMTASRSTIAKALRMRGATV